MELWHGRSPAYGRLHNFFLVLIFLISSTGVAQENGADTDFNPKTYSSDEAATSEVSRIEALKPSKSPVLNEAAREEIKGTIQHYSNEVQRLRDLSGMQLDKVSADTRENVRKQFARLSSAAPKCDEPDVVGTRQQIAGALNYILEGYDPVKITTPQSADDLHQSEPVKSLLIPYQEFCQQYKTTESIGQLTTNIDHVIDDALGRLQKGQVEAKAMIARIPKIIDAWTKYKSDLEKAIEDNATPANRVADQLWAIIAVFCAFAILIFLAVKLFGAEIQLELIASGQVIQFATVMVILIVICVLGISGILKENTLGTLLGGIGGYVLSQGVGRAAGRAAAQAARDVVPKQD